MIDTHHHLWQITRPECCWPTADLSAIYRDFDSAEWDGLARQAGVAGSVLVQSQASDADTDFLLQQADQSSLIKAVVGWVDLASPGAEARIAQLAAHPKMRGLRPMLQGMADTEWILRPELAPALKAMQSAGFSFDALVYPRHLPALVQFAARYPQLPLVIDHFAKPAIAANDSAAVNNWQTQIARLAQLPQVYIKLSGLITEAAAGQGIEALQAYVDWVIGCFGAERVLWGSDWPVLRLAPNKQLASYRAWQQAAQTLCAGLSIEQREWIFTRAAQKFYRIS